MGTPIEMHFLRNLQTIGTSELKLELTLESERQTYKRLDL